MDPRESDLIKAASVGFGVFMGIFPIWGGQLITAITLAFLFRLNKTLVIIAANISIPPMIPLVLYLSHLTGKLWMGEKAQSMSFSDDLTFAYFHDNMVQYALGAVTLAIVAGLAFGFLTYGMIKLSKWRKNVTPG